MEPSKKMIYFSDTPDEGLQYKPNFLGGPDNKISKRLMSGELVGQQTDPH